MTGKPPQSEKWPYSSCMHHCLRNTAPRMVLEAEETGWSGTLKNDW